MDGAQALASLDVEVQRIADDLTPELLPLLLERMVNRDALVFCNRHDRLLFSYVRAQINLTRAKRNFYLHGTDNYLDPHHDRLYGATVIRDDIRTTYRSTPCTCWVHHR